MPLAQPSDHSARLVSSGTTPARVIETPHPVADCSCSQVMVHGRWVVKMHTPRCHSSIHDGVPMVPWSSRPRFWSVGHLS
jgi:hypothetical protein